MLEFNTTELRQFLLLRSPSDIREVHIVDEFEDDHIPCATIRINDSITEFKLYWCGSKVIGACSFFDQSERARNEVFKAITAEIESRIITMFDYTDEDLMKEVLDNREGYRAVVDYLNTNKRKSIYKEIKGYNNLDDVKQMLDLV